MKMNIKNRKFKNEKYLNFIRSLPCAVYHKLINIDAHHTDVIGMSRIRNDFYAIPLSHFLHVGNKGHITREKLEEYIGEDVRDLVIFYLSIYILYLQEEYDPRSDSMISFVNLKRKKNGVE